MVLTWQGGTTGGVGVALSSGSPTARKLWQKNVMFWTVSRLQVAVLTSFNSFLSKTLTVFVCLFYANITAVKHVREQFLRALVHG
jgi:hypothetical protein